MWQDIGKNSSERSIISYYQDCIKKLLNARLIYSERAFIDDIVYIIIFSILIQYLIKKGILLFSVKIEVINQMDKRANCSLNFLSRILKKRTIVCLWSIDIDIYTVQQRWGKGLIFCRWRTNNSMRLFIASILFIYLSSYHDPSTPY